MVKFLSLIHIFTVPSDTFDKTFGDAAFKLDVTEDNPEADVTYTSDNTDVALSLIHILDDEPVVFRISGCPNGCSRPLFAEL